MHLTVPGLFNKWGRSSPTTPTGSSDDTKDLLKAFNLTGQVDKGENCYGGGGYADVWDGVWRKPDGNPCKVAIKVVRSVYTEDPLKRERFMKKLRREIYVWSALNHPNILKLHGVVDGIGFCPSMVAVWADNGNLNDYLKSDAGLKLSVTDRFLLWQADYLLVRDFDASLKLQIIESNLRVVHSHTPPIIHGDVTGPNILISGDGVAMLADFGLSVVITEFEGNSAFATSSVGQGGAIRWAAPEVCATNDQPSSVSTHSDVYSYGSIMLQILTGKPPYYYLNNIYDVVNAVQRGDPPQRPSMHIDADHWSLIMSCWHTVPDQRPNIMEVQGKIRVAYNNLSAAPAIYVQPVVEPSIPDDANHSGPSLIHQNGPISGAPSAGFTTQQNQKDDIFYMLSTYNTVFIVDDSTSMKEERRWTQARDALKALAAMAEKYDNDGIDIYFLNNEAKGENLKGKDAVERLFRTVYPNGGTMIGRKLEDLLLKYLEQLDKAKSQGTTGGIKPVNYIVITDGEPSDDPADVIVQTAKRLDKSHYPTNQVGIQFVQVGSDKDAAAYLAELDDELSKKHDIRDMVDTTPYDGGEFDLELLKKILLGGINRRLDKREITHKQ